MAERETADGFDVLRTPRAAGPADRAISVVIANHNRAELAERCLRALLDQDLPGVQIVVVDDLSNDGTRERLVDFVERHPDADLTLVLNEENVRANRSRNRGLTEAKADLIAFLDNDAFAEPDWARRMVARFREEPDLAGVTGDVTTPDPRNVYDRVFRGTNRVAVVRGNATRFVGCNCCFRSGPLLEAGWAEDAITTDARFGSRCDEEGLYTVLRRAGWRFGTAPEASVCHEHHLDRAGFYRVAFRGGRAAARLVHLYRLPQRIDVLPLMAAYATALPAAVLAVLLSPLGLLALSLPIGCFALAAAAYL